MADYVPIQFSRSSLSTSSTAAGMPRNPPYITTSHHSSRSMQNTQRSHVGNLPSRGNRSPSGAYSEASQPRMQPPNSQRGHGDESALTSRCLTEFADFLVQFNNTTVLAVNSRLERIESIVVEYLRRAEVAQREHEQRISDRLATTAQVGREVANNCSRCASSGSGQEADLAEAVSGSVLSALGPRFDDINRRIDENDSLTRALQTTIKSLESRLKKLETRVLSSASAPVSSSVSPTLDGLAALSRRMDELGHMLDRLAGLVDGARDEAHLDKEDIAKLLEQRFHDLSLTFLKECSAVNSVIGVGKGCLRVSEDNSSNLSPSLSEFLERLGLDIQEAIKLVKDSEAARDEELLASIATKRYHSRNLLDAAVMTENTRNDITGNKSHSEMKANLSSFSTQPEPFLESNNTVGSPLSTPKAGDFGLSTINTPIPTDISPAMLTTGADFAPGGVSASLLPVSSWCIPFPRHSTCSPRPPSSHLTLLDTNLDSVQDETSLMTTALQLSCVPSDPSGSLITPPPSSVPPSPDSIEGKAEANKEEEIPEGIDRESTVLSTPLTSLDDVTDTPDLGEYFSEPISTDSPPAVDFSKSPSPLTPLPSEDGDFSSDEDNNVVTLSLNSEAEKESAVAESHVSLPAERPCTDNDAGGTVPEFDIEEDSAFVGHQTSSSVKRPHKSGQRSICESERNEYVAKERTNSQDDQLPQSKRRKLTHDVGKSSTPAQSHEKRRRDRSKKSQNAMANVHPPEVLEKCDWPAKTMVNETFDHQLLQCDRCDSSFHYRCIGVKEGDRRLVPEEEFICPPCVYVNESQCPTKKNDACCCRRPDCDWPGEASDDKTDYFVVDRILGRCTTETSDSGRFYLWLIKWTGYHIKESSWLEESALPNADELISKFYSSAARERMKLHDEGPIYLLREARRKLRLAIKEKWKWV